MKHISFLFYLIILCLGSTAANVQAQSYAVDRGSLPLDGSASFSSSGSSGDINRVNQASFSPTAQYFVMPGLAAGGGIHLGYTSFSESSFTSYGIEPTVTYFFGSGERSIFPYVSGSAGITARFRNSEDSTTYLSYGGSGGVVMMLSRSVGLSGELFYRGLDTDVASNTYGLAFGIKAFLF